MPLDDFDETLEKPPLPEVPDQRKPKRRRFRRRWIAVGCLLFLLAGILFLNGPGFRFIGSLAAEKFASSQGLEGDLTITGTLWSGFGIQDLEWNPVSPREDGKEITKPEIVSVKVSNFEVSYCAIDIIRNAAGLGWLDRLELDTVELVLALPEPVESEKKENTTTEKETSPRDDFHPVWNLLRSDIRIRNFSAKIQQGSGEYVVKGFGLESIPDKPGEIGLSSITLPGYDTVSDVEVEINGGEHELSLGPVSLAPVGEIHELKFAEASPGVFTFGISAQVADGEIRIALTEQQSLVASLKPGTTIRLAKLFPERADEFPLAGTVSELDLQFHNPFAVPSHWDIAARLKGEKISWAGKAINTAQLTVQSNTVSVELSRPDATVNVQAFLPLETVESTDELAHLPINIEASAKVPEMETLLSNLELEVPVNGSLHLGAKGIRLDTKGNLLAGNLLLDTGSLSYDGLDIRKLQLAGVVEKPKQINLAIDAAIDSSNHLRVVGHYDQKAASYTAKAEASFDADATISEWLREKDAGPFSGNGALSWSGSGSVSPSRHKGAGSLSIEGLSAGTMQPVESSLSFDYENSRFDLRSFLLQAGPLALSGTGHWDGDSIHLTKWRVLEKMIEVASLSAKIPMEENRENGFLGQAGDVETDLKFRNFRIESLLSIWEAEPVVAGYLNGSIKTSGPFNGLAANGDLAFLPSNKHVGDDSKLNLNFDFSGNVSAPRTWKATVDADLSGAHYRDVELGTATLDLRTEILDVRNRLAGNLFLDHAGTELDANLFVDLTRAESIGQLSALPIDFDARLAVESVGALIRDFAPPNLAGLPVDGSLHAELDGFRLQERSLKSGRAFVQSETLEVSGEPFESIQIDALVDQPDHLIANLDVQLDEKSAAEGQIGYYLSDALYDGALAVRADIAGQGKLNRLLSGRNITKLLPAKTGVEWEGGGNLKEKTHRGDLKLDTTGLTLSDGAVPIDLALAGSYTEKSANFPDFALRSSVFDLDGSLLWDSKTLNLSNWLGKNEERDIFALNAELPLTPDSLGPQWLSGEDPLDIDLKISDLEVASFSRLFLKESPIRANLNFDLNASGTPIVPKVAGDLKLDKIVLPNPKGDIPLGRLDLDLDIASEKAGLAGNFLHPDLKPLAITAGFPFFPADWVTGKRKFAEESILATAKMDRSSLSFLAGRVPAIESVDGTVGINAKLAGTLAKPDISGDGILEISRLRLDSRDAPSFYDIDLETRFADNQITIDRLHAIVAGGIIDGKGSIQLPPGSEPEFDIALSGQEVLVYRNPDLSLRTDADLTLTGPLPKAHLAGEIGITNSRYFKNFDLLPRSLPTRNTSVLPTVERGPRGGGMAYQDLDFGVKQEPFRDWTADVRIYSKNPFLVRSNLVESDIAADLNLGGTLGNPVPVGYVELAEGEMSLPFSSIDVETGRITFDEKTGFNGALEFKAKAKADKYRINAYVYNRVLDPKYVLTSVPPMPTEDLVTLIATGTARSDLVGEGVGSLAAGKAATLLFQNMRKASAEADEEPTLLDNLQERTELDIGGVNPETGETTVGGKIRLWKQLFFVGDVDARNDYRAVLKYVFRFR